ncbi:MAG: DUF4920 domain-containing protein [Bacteroidetes bacterium]|nr:DUF4920 domain-containing protein [Bacteroidota bacterium]MDA1120097.1 DUF4920 domain-containing protein [Bacteroidota bacterium]
MKKHIFTFIISSVLFSCQSANNEQASNDTNIQYASYGAEITPEDPSDITSLQALLAGNDALDVKLTGEIEKTCTAKGCWMTLKTGDNNAMRVTFKDYGFFVPKEGVEGKKAIVEGVLTKTTTSVEMLRHFALDAGKTAEEIDAITEPKEEFAFEATGVLIQEL